MSIYTASQIRQSREIGQDVAEFVAPVAAVGLGLVEDLEVEDVVLEVFTELLPGDFAADLREDVRNVPLVVDVRVALRVPASPKNSSRRWTPTACWNSKCVRNFQNFPQWCRENRVGANATNPCQDRWLRGSDTGATHAFDRQFFDCSHFF